MPHFHHFSICNQNQSISNLVIFHQNTMVYSLTFRPNMPHFHHFSICNQNQSISSLVIFHQNTKAIALLFGQPYLIFITFQSAIKSINFKFGHFSPKYQGYSLTFWPKMPHFHHFSICNQNQSISNLVIFHQNTKVYSLTFRPKMPHFHHFSICNQNQSISNLVIFHQNTMVYSLTFRPNMPHFHHFSICNQNQSISSLVIFHQNTKAIALLFGQPYLIFITFQSAIKINQFQIWSFFTKIPRL